MFATMPQLAKEWAGETDFSKLPEKSRKKKRKKDKSDVDDMKMSIDQIASLVKEFAKQVKNK